MEKINRNALTHIDEMRFLNVHRKHMNHGEEKRFLAYVRKELEIETNSFVSASRTVLSEFLSAS